MVGCHDGKRAGLKTGPQAILVLFVAERGRHDAARGMVPIRVEVFAFVQRQMLDQRFTPNALALLAGAADGFVRFFARRVDNIERHTRHIGDHNRAVGCFAFDLRGAGISVGLGACVAFCQKLGGQFRNHIAVFGVHHGDAAQIGETVERCVKFVIVDHQRAFVGHEVFERVDAAIFDHGFHLIKDLLAPPCDGHVEGIVTVRAGRFVVPHLKCVQQALTGRRQRKIDDHRGATGQRRACAAFEIVA